MLFFGKPVPNPSCIPNLKLLSSTDAEINRGGPNFLDTPLARTPANFGRKSCFSASYSPSPSCILNLKLVASMVAEINWGSQIFTYRNKLLNGTSLNELELPLTQISRSRYYSTLNNSKWYKLELYLQWTANK